MSKNINTRGHIVNYIFLDKCRTVMETFLESQFDWCPQVWIFTAELSIINLSLHERALRTVYFDYTPSFEGLLNKDNSFSIHEKKIFIQSLAIEISKFLNGLSQRFWNNLFPKIPQNPMYFEIDKV